MAKKRTNWSTKFCREMLVKILSYYDDIPVEVLERCNDSELCDLAKNSKKEIDAGTHPKQRVIERFRESILKKDTPGKPPRITEKKKKSDAKTVAALRGGSGKSKIPAPSMSPEQVAATLRR